MKHARVRVLTYLFFIVVHFLVIAIEVAGCSYGINELWSSEQFVWGENISNIRAPDQIATSSVICLLLFFYRQNLFVSKHRFV